MRGAALGALLLAGAPALGLAQDAPPLECAGLETLVSLGLVSEGEAADISALAGAGDPAACGAELESRGFPGFRDRACRAALTRILTDGVPSRDGAGASFEDPGVVLPLVLSGENPITCAALANAP